MSLWSELKRRNVFRVAAAYLVIGWLALQVSGIVLGMVGAPEWVGKSIIALLILGFVPVLALAWVFEVGPEGIRVDDGSTDRGHGPQARRLDIITLCAVVLVLLLMVWQYLAPAFRKPVDVQPTLVPETIPAEPPVPVEAPPFEILPGSLAVLPFTNRSTEPDTAHFVDGVHDDLLTELARNPNLIVISRTSMMEYRDTTKNLRQIGEELAVGHILEGAVQRAGDRVRINAQLIDTRTDAHLWADTFDRRYSPESVFELQSEIAAAIAIALGRALGMDTAPPDIAAAPTTNPDAYDLYLRARTGASRESEASIRRTMVLYRQALEHDPDFALAMGELGLALTDLYWFFTRRESDRDEARLWIDRSLDREPEHPRLRWILARHLYHGEYDYDGALAQLTLAETDLPGSAEVFALRGWILRRDGRVEEAIRALERAALLDPRSEDVLYSLCETHVLLGDLEAAQVWQRRLAQVPGAAPGSLICYDEGRLNVLGDIDAYVYALEENPIEPGSEFNLGPLLIDYLQRDFGAAEQTIATYPLELIEYQFFFVPISLLHARIVHAAGNRERAHEQAGVALANLEAVLAEHPGDYRVMMAKAQALAFSERVEEARHWANRALDEPTVARDPLLLGTMMRDRLEVLALVADSEELAREIETYVQLPIKYVHFDGLMLDPLFDPHRDYPAIQALAARYSRREPDP